MFSRIERHAASIQAQKGQRQQYQISAGGQTVLLGSQLIELEKEQERINRIEQHFLATMGKYIDMADGWGQSGQHSLWLYFHTEAKTLEVAAALKTDGHRRLEAFPSPASAPEQLSFTLTVQTKAFLESDNSKRMEGLMRELGIDPVCVSDMYDRSFIVELDSAFDNSRFIKLFKPMFEKAVPGNKIETHKRWCKDHLGLTRQYRIVCSSEETVNV